MDFLKVYEYTKNLNILYVEDDKELIKNTTEVLSDFFQTIQIAQNGQEGLNTYNRYYDEHNKYFDLVITDINMPIMDGETFIKEIKNVYFDQTIIVVSAYNESSRLIALIQNGITNFVLKPVAPTQLMEVLYKTCKSVFHHNEMERYKKELESINKNLDLKVQELSAEILATQRISIETITDMVENYDDDTGTHVKRIESYTKLMLNKLPPTDELCDLKDSIPFASLLHDIGKLLIPKHILNKPAKHNDEEMQIMKTHAKLGGDILLKANERFKIKFNKDSYLKIASDIAMYHHEKFDGTGYPQGLKAHQIPISARIVAIADVYDALRSKRVYKEGFSHSKSIDIIKSESAKAFDPVLVNIFLIYEREFEEIFERSGI